ncbi:hypothetical protein FVF58_04140 [Paraburkholderia panacisoli]|uniref:Uncharacterized protein n=1 Tax=Paraburkholderia panacisoli TaxID=2603818 RepID=A0A5B0HJ15_9BURK|nr:hypothetical protein [Paraburkholderia panacisoli]KAA1015118.1 hypothetical protein FVF58_04140 [Paraburkholderia panacisoli]
MTKPQNISALIQEFRSLYDAEQKDQVWRQLSQRVRNFWDDRILSSAPGPLSDAECDEIIRILDRSGKGNRKDSEAIAKVMVPQGAWRRMLNEFHSNKELGRLLFDVLNESDARRKANLIDELYAMNAGQKNNLTGPSGNTVGAYLAAYDPVKNISMVSLNDRRAVIEFLGLPVNFEWESATIGTRMVETNRIILIGMRQLGLEGTARTIASFFYLPSVKARWKGEDTVKRIDNKDVSVTVPTVPDEDEDDAVDGESVRESMQIQGLIARIGAAMGFTIWLPKADRSRVLKVWQPGPDSLIDELPLSYGSTTMKTIEQIDVLWLRKRSIVRAFEVEHTTSVYSGLLRMADLVALQPNIYLKLHIVAPAEKREKVLQEIKRPVFSLLEGRALKEMCTYLSYDNVKDIGDLKHLGRMSDEVIEDYEEAAE